MDTDKIASVLRDTIAPVLKDVGYPMAAETVNSACDLIAELETEVASREQSSIEEHNEVHCWRDRAKKAESDLSALQSRNKEAMELLEAALKELICAADDNGGCYGCLYLSADEKCTSELGRVMCDCKTNNMWRWQHADRYEALKTQFSEST